jgi:hypothetical protein
MGNVTNEKGQRRLGCARNATLDWQKIASKVNEILDLYWAIAQAQTDSASFRLSASFNPASTYSAQRKVDNLLRMSHSNPAGIHRNSPCKALELTMAGKSTKVIYNTQMHTFRSVKVSNHVRM